MPKTIHRPEYAVLCALVRKSRLAAGLTQAELSDALGRPQSYISDIERGTRRLDLIELRDICDSLGSEFVDFIAQFETQVARKHSRTRRK
jgi:transcriptional regulator with XRE-family HTH domain